MQVKSYLLYEPPLFLDETINTKSYSRLQIITSRKTEVILKLFFTSSMDLSFVQSHLTDERFIDGSRIQTNNNEATIPPCIGHKKI